MHIVEKPLVYDFVKLIVPARLVTLKRVLAQYALISSASLASELATQVAEWEPLRRATILAVQWTPKVRQPVNSQLAVRWKSIVGRAALNSKLVPCMITDFLLP